MPNRVRKGKPKAVPNAVASENDIQFNLELLWCIRQIQDTLVMKKIGPKQAQEASYSLNVLKSKTAPVIKKRQVMKAALGDYRSKMIEEQKKLVKVQEKVTLTSVSPSEKSQFFKKSSFFSLESAGNTFRFNFNTPASETEETENAQKENNNKPNDSSTADFRFIPSDNSFRFAFSQPAS